MSQDTDTSMSSEGSSVTNESFSDDYRVTNVLRASIKKSIQPLEKEYTKEISRKLEWEFENDLLSMNFQKIPQRLKSLSHSLERSDEVLHHFKSFYVKLAEKEKAKLKESQTQAEYFKKLEEFLLQKSLFNFKLKEQLETSQQEFEKIKMYYTNLQKNKTQQTLQLQHASNKITNMSEKFSLLLDSLKDSEGIMEKVKTNLESLSSDGFKQVHKVHEISLNLEDLASISTRCNEKLESLEMENNILRADISTFNSSSSNGEHHLKKSKTINEDSKKKYFVSIAEPVMLSTHLYLEALQEKIAEVHELKRALADVAAHGTDEDIKEELNFKISSKLGDHYRNKYIADAVKHIKKRFDLERSKYDRTEYDRKLETEKVKFEDLFSRYKKEVTERRYLHNKLEDLKGHIRVYCRVRTTLKGETNQVPLQNEPYIGFPDAHSIHVQHNPQKRDLNFELNHVFHGEDTQNTVFDEVNPLIESAMDGYNTCIMAYGQTGAGKTYTMIGNDNEPGIVPRSVHRMFEIANERAKDYDYQVCASIVEIYNEQVRDLLSYNPTNKIEVREFNNTVHIMPCLMAPEIKNAKDAFDIIEKGNSNRTIGSTYMNEVSSRSHLIVMFTIFSTNKVTGKSYTSRLNLIDLAGSERLYKSESEGERMKEACHINQSLTTLGKVLNSLATKSPHIPYRESKLTHILKESLAGDSKTLLIIQVSPDPHELSETLSTLQFGTRVMKIEKGKAKQNVLQDVDVNVHKITLPNSPKSIHSSNSKVSTTISSRAESPQVRLIKDTPLTSKSVAHNKENTNTISLKNKIMVRHVHTKSLKIDNLTRSPKSPDPSKRRLTTEPQTLNSFDSGKSRRLTSDSMGSHDLIGKVGKINLFIK